MGRSTQIQTKIEKIDTIAWITCRSESRAEPIDEERINKVKCEHDDKYG